MAQKFAIRLSVEDAEKVRVALKGMGADGAAALKTFGDAADRAAGKTRGFRQETANITPGMRALDNAAKDLRAEFDGLAGRIPVVGSALQALGPAGLAAAAGVVAIGAGFTAMLQNSRQTIEQLSAIKDAADNVALGIEDFQAFRGVSLIAGIDAEATESMLATLAINSARASEGFGKMYAALQRVNPQLAEQLALSTTQAERLDILAKAVQGAATYNEKLNIAVAAFGSEGRQLIRVLDESGASMDTWRAKAEDAGLVVEASLVNAVDAIGDRIAELEARTGVAAQRLGVATAPVLESVEEFKGDFLSGLAEIFEGFKALEDQTDYFLKVRRNRILGAMNQPGPNQYNVLPHYRAEIEQIEALLRARAELARTEKGIADAGGPGWMAAEANASRRPAWLTPGADALSAIDKERAEQERRADEAARIRAGHEREAIQIRADLGDITGVLAVREKELAAIVAANVGVTREMADDVLRRYRESLDGTATAQARINAILEDAKTPAERIQDGINALTLAWEASGRTLKDYGVALAALKSQLQDAVAADADLASGVEASNKKIGEGADALDAYAQQLGEARRLSFEVEFGMAGIVGILDQQIETWGDAGEVALRVLRDIAIQAMYTAAQIEGANLGSIIAAGFGVFMGGWGGATAGSPGALDGMKNIPGSGGRVGGFKNAGLHHTGGIGGYPVHSRLVPGSIFDNAPRNHSGYPLAPDERAAILQVGEPVVAKWDANRIMRAVEGGGRGADVKVNIYNQSGGEVKTTERRNANGGRELDIMIGEKINNHIAAGGADGPMGQRYNVQPPVGR